MIVTTLAGIIQHTPRVANTRSDEPVLNLNVAVRQRIKKDGAWVNETLWVDVTLFGRRAVGLAAILNKGSQLGATGELRMRRYEGRDGTQKTAIELVATSIWPLDWTPREQSEEGDTRASFGKPAPSGAALTRTHRDEFAGQQTRGGSLVRGQQQLLDAPADDGPADWQPPLDDDIPF
jgi:single-strand DNA-binding protein